MTLDPSQVAGAKRVTEVPRFVSPQLATLVENIPEGDDWSHEIKFDGYRAIASVVGGQSEIRSRNDKDWTVAYRALAVAVAALPARSAVLDGEVVAVLPDGTTSFEALRHLARIPARGGSGPSGRQGKSDLTETIGGQLIYYAFDLLFLDDHDLLDVPLEKRRELLQQLLADSGPATTERVRFSDRIVGDGPTVLREACGLGLEGVVSKKSGSRYHPGTRGPQWVKTKCRHEQEFVIGGFTDPAGARVGFGALLLGVYDERGLRYVSRVGTGFDDALLSALGSRLRALEVTSPAFAIGLPKDVRGVHWVQPTLVAQVSFLEWTSTGGIRHPSFKGLREDKPAREVVAESSAGGRRRG